MNVPSGTAASLRARERDSLSRRGLAELGLWELKLDHRTNATGPNTEGAPGAPSVVPGTLPKPPPDPATRRFLFDG